MTAGWSRLDERALRQWPLPAVPDDADKEDRGRVVVIGGSREIAGAAQLAGIAALRAGAGKLVIATAQSVAPAAGQAVPEARVIPLAETPTGAFEAAGADALAHSLDGAAAVLIGPGMMDPEGNIPFIERVLARSGHARVVVDACAMDVVQRLRRFAQPVLLTPHAGEMCHLLGIAKEEVLAAPEVVAARAAREWNAVVALKGATTLLATPGGPGWRHAANHPGLATSGSGDVLAGLAAGFAARAESLEQACAWAVVLHALAGQVLARETAPLGFLARELPAPVPRLVRRIESRVRRPRQPTAG